MSHLYSKCSPGCGVSRGQGGRRLRKGVLKRIKNHSGESLRPHSARSCRPAGRYSLSLLLLIESIGSLGARGGEATEGIGRVLAPPLGWGWLRGLWLHPCRVQRERGFRHASQPASQPDDGGVRESTVFALHQSSLGHVRPAASSARQLNVLSAVCSITYAKCSTTLFAIWPTRHFSWKTCSRAATATGDPRPLSLDMLVTRRPSPPPLQPQLQLQPPSRYSSSA